MLVFCAWVLPVGGVAAAAAARAVAAEPIVIAHRGASGLRPEHTLAAYELALVQGADFIELDLVATADGVLIARHENALAVVARDQAGAIRRTAGGAPEVVWATTDVADRAEFADRLTLKTVDGRPVAGWFSEDFTAAEIAILRARERMPELRPGNSLYDDRFGVPTLAEVVALVRRFERRTGARPGLYIELKHPTYFQHQGRTLDGSAIGLDLGALLLAELRNAGFVASERLFVQCFEVAPLLAISDRMASIGLEIPLIQLFGDLSNRRYRAAPQDLAYHVGRSGTDRYGELATLIPGGLTAELSYADLAAAPVLAFMARRYATGIGAPVANLLPRRWPEEGRGRPRLTGEPSQLLADALAAGLLIHPYTLRAEAPFRPERAGRLLDLAGEAALLLEAGVHGFFIDQPSEGRLAVYRHAGGALP